MYNQNPKLLFLYLSYNPSSSENKKKYKKL